MPLNFRIWTESSRIRENSEAAVVAGPPETRPNSHEFGYAQLHRHMLHNSAILAAILIPPHGFDLTGHVQPGRNQLRIDVPNILKNHLEPGEYVRPSGLLGPVRVRPVGRVFLPVTTP